MVGQHSVPELLSRAAALSAVDDFAGAGALSSEMRKRYRRVAALRRQAAEAADRGAGARSRTETLDFEIGELSKAALTPGEEEELAADLSLLRNAAKVREALQAADDAIASSENAALVIDGVRPRAPAGGGRGRPAARRNRRTAPLRPRGGAGSLPGARIRSRPG